MRVLPRLQILSAATPGNREAGLRRLKESGVRVMTGTTVSEVKEDGGVVLQQTEGEVIRPECFRPSFDDAAGCFAPFGKNNIFLPRRWRGYDVFCASYLARTRRRFRALGSVCRFLARGFLRTLSFGYIDAEEDTAVRDRVSHPVTALYLPFKGGGGGQGRPAGLDGGQPAQPPPRLPGRPEGFERAGGGRPTPPPRRSRRRRRGSGERRGRCVLLGGHRGRRGAGPGLQRAGTIIVVVVVVSLMFHNSLVVSSARGHRVRSSIGAKKKNCGAQTTRAIPPAGRACRRTSAEIATEPKNVSCVVDSDLQQTSTFLPTHERILVLSFFFISQRVAGAPASGPSNRSFMPAAPRLAAVASRLPSPTLFL